MFNCWGLVDRVHLAAPIVQMDLAELRCSAFCQGTRGNTEILNASLNGKSAEKELFISPFNFTHISLNTVKKILTYGKFTRKKIFVLSVS